MTLMKREEWQDLVRDVDWTLTYVDDDAVFPEWHSGTGKVPREAWWKWEEGYKITYPEYVATQREKEASGVRGEGSDEALQRLRHPRRGVEVGDPQVHYGAVTLVEYLAGLAERGWPASG